MEGKRTVPVWLSVVMLVLSVAVAAYGVYIVANSDPMADFPLNIDFISSIFGVLCAVSSVAYCIYGYKKSAAAWYKMVGMCHVVTTLLALVVCVCLPDRDYTATAILALVLGAKGILAFANDLGKRMTDWLAGLSLCLLAIYLIYSIVCTPSHVGSALSALAMHIVYVVMVFAKYRDKAARGTK